MGVGEITDTKINYKILYAIHMLIVDINLESFEFKSHFTNKLEKYFEISF